MDCKKASTRFSIFLNPEDPRHAQAAEIISQQGYRGKAQYIVQAVLHYEGDGGTPGGERPARLDEKAIEAVVNRVLQDRNIAPAPVEKQTKAMPRKKDAAPAAPDEKAAFDGSEDELGGDGLNAVLGALEMFRNG